MGNSGRLRRGQHLLPDGATAREQQRKLIEEARAARRGEQIAQPQEQARIAPRLPPRMSQPSRSQLDRMEVPFYPDDLFYGLLWRLGRNGAERLAPSLRHSIKRTSLTLHTSIVPMTETSPPSNTAWMVAVQPFI